MGQDLRVPPGDFDQPDFSAARLVPNPRIGPQVSVWYGTPAGVFRGESVSVSVDVSIGPVTVTGSAFFSAPPGGFVFTAGSHATIPAGFTPDLIGIGFGLSAGASVLPLDLAIGPSHTWIRPLTPWGL